MTRIAQLALTSVDRPQFLPRFLGRSGDKVLVVLPDRFGDFGNMVPQGREVLEPAATGQQGLLSVGCFLFVQTFLGGEANGGLKVPP